MNVCSDVKQLKSLRFRDRFIETIHTIRKEGFSPSLVHITHTDPDGLVCGIITDLLYSNRDKSSYYSVDEVWFEAYTLIHAEPYELLGRLETLCETAVPGGTIRPMILITDLNFTKKHQALLDQYNYPYFVLDHHVTDLEDEWLKEHPNVICEYRVPDDAEYSKTAEAIKQVQSSNLNMSSYVPEWFAMADTRSGASLVADAFFGPWVSCGASNKLRRLYYLSRAIASRDTFQHMRVPGILQEVVLENDRSYIGGCDIDRYTVGNRLKILFDTMGTEFFCDYIRAYLEYPRFADNGFVADIWHVDELSYNTPVMISTHGENMVGTIIDISNKQTADKIAELEKSAFLISTTLPTEVSPGVVEAIEYRVACVVADSAYASDLGAKLCTEHGADVAFIRTNTYEVSLRAATDRIDVGAIARACGGGGHKRAAGFRVSMNNYDLFVKNEIKTILDGAGVAGYVHKSEKIQEPNVLRWKTEIQDANTGEWIPVDYRVAIIENSDIQINRDTVKEEDADLIAHIQSEKSLRLYLNKKDPSVAEITHFDRVCGASALHTMDITNGMRSMMILIGRTDGDWLTRARFNGIMNLTGRTLTDIPKIHNEEDDPNATKLKDIPQHGFDRYVQARDLAPIIHDKD